MPLAEVLTVAEVAQLAGRHPESTRVWIRAGWLPATKIGSVFLVNAEDFEAFQLPLARCRPVRRPVEAADEPL
jgi:excisionase family DNA binding protein